MKKTTALEAQRRVTAIDQAEEGPESNAERLVLYPKSLSPLAEPPLSPTELRFAERATGEGPEAEAALVALEAKRPGWKNAPNAPVDVEGEMSDYDRGAAGLALPQPGVPT